MDIDTEAEIKTKTTTEDAIKNLQAHAEPGNRPTHYIGIGASAGGLEALQELFDNIPDGTGAAFIVVQHLSPDFKSVMAEILSKHTNMPIYNITDGAVVEPNTVYLIPPRKNMLMAEGRLLLSDQDPEQGIHLPIDVFFRSLAEDQQHRAVGIILSGTGSDGSRGVRALKEVGGLVVVQDPDSAKFDGMPHNAAASGLADFILSAADIPDQLVKYIHHPLISGKNESLKAHIQSNEELMQEMFSLLKRKSEIDFSLYKPSTVARRIERRMGINQLTSLRDYFTMLLEQPKELQTLSKELLIGVTRFFRDDEAFLAIENKIIDDIFDATPLNEPIRVWSVGCSTGEEPYSLAILFQEALARRNERRTVKVFGTDVDGDAIAEASSGRYSKDIQQDVSPARLAEFFVEDGDGYIISADIRQTVIFATHNMINDPPFSNVNLVVCRNALIYLQNSAQKKVLIALHFALKKEGILFLGPSESLSELHAHFEVIDERSKLFRKLSNIRIPVSTPSPMKAMPDNSVMKGMLPINNLLRSHRDYSKASPFNVVKEKLIESHVPPCIILNEDFEALHVYGDVGDFVKRLPAGRVTTNIRDLIVDDLNIAVSTALSRVEKDKARVYYTDLITRINGEEVVVDLDVSFVKESNVATLPGFYVVMFKTQDRAATTEDRESTRFDMADQSRQRIQDLEQELTKKQEHLQVTIEELETTNEELQSANEELLSANEELQSTNEELQSVNEELYTVNSEYQEKIIELTQANSDLDNVIEATRIGIIFLDENLLLRRFTPFVTKYFNLLPTDFGRPIHHISHSLLYDDLIKDIAKVGETGEFIEREVSTKDGQGLLMRITQYLVDHRNETHGIVVTFTNITRLKIVEGALERAHNELRETIKETTSSGKQSVIDILVVDDCKADRVLVKKLLNEVTSLSCKITEATNISQALEYLRSDQSFDICLLDYRLEDDKATTLLKEMNELNISVPTIILSGYSEVGVDEDLTNAPIGDFINKEHLSSAVLKRSITASLQKLRD